MSGFHEDDRDSDGCLAPVAPPPSTAPADGRKPTPRHRPHLPAAHQHRPGAVDASRPVMRVTPAPIPRLENPAHVHLQTQNSSSGARSKLYLLNNMARLFGAEDHEHLVWHDLRAPVVHFILAHLREAGYKASTRNAYLAALKGIAKESWAMEVMSPDTFERIRAIRPASNPRKPKGRAHDIATLRGLIQAAASDGTPTARRNALIITFMASLGIRREEVTRIQVPRDIDFRSQEIHIHGKGNKERLVVPPEPVWRALLDYLETERGYDSGALFCPYWNNRSAPVIGENGLTLGVINYVLSKARRRCAELLGEAVTPHDLRRSFATFMHEQGMSIRELQVLLGHANSATTEAYVRDEKDAYRHKAAELAKGLF
ncbi:tyrosine-type recombinase/integrase [Halomonas stenophila]|uniref:Integrase n=1 Tax=Halomonas stenophila TaxID=795312 RepID=A0A7W5ER28_9GAMM|nr:site-specific integrase [Halomonas stenophila]MBB3229907.1 integrase [Halomonas stenophila]